jgi:ligand-binding sensor domain-containing protein
MHIHKSYAQDFPKLTFRHVNNYNQIPNEACNNIFKDSNGFLWISTMEGLCRYDGKNTTLYNYEYNNKQSITIHNYEYNYKQSIASGTVQAATEDKEGNIWVSQTKGISFISSKSGRITNYFHVKSDSNSIIGNYSLVRIDNEGNIFNTDRDGYELKLFEKETKRFIPIFLDTANDGFNNRDESNKLIGTLSARQYDGSMYLLSNNGIFLFDSKKFTRKRLCRSLLYEPLCIFKDHNKKIWLGEWDGGLNVINEKTQTERNIIAGRKIESISEYKDIDGKYWLLASDSKTGSIIIIDPVTEKYQEQLLKIENETITNLVPRTIYCYPDGGIYVTSAAGLLVASRESQTINNIYTYERGKPADILSDNLVCSGLKLNNGNYAFGIYYNNGLRIYDSTFLLKKIIKKYSYRGKNYDLDVTGILNIGTDKYLLSGETGIALMQKAEIIPLQYVSEKKWDNDTLYSLVRKILPRSKNIFWVKMASDGIKLFNIEKNRFTKDYIFADKAKKIPLNNVRNIVLDKNGALWANNYFNIFLYDSIADEFIMQPINENAKYLSEMYSIGFDSAGTIWIAGEEGLLKYNRTTRKQEFFNTKNGLANNIIFKALADNENNIWIIHQTGISMLNSKNNTFTNYNKNDGLPLFYSQPNGVSFFDKKNNLIIGSEGIITIINVPQLRSIRQLPCKTVITQVQGIDSSIIIQKNKENHKQITLTYENFPVNILFSIIDYTTNGQRKYFYRYTGSDTTWIESKYGVVPINTSAPGTYTIEVTGNVNNLYSDNIDRLTFTILPKWYQTFFLKLISILTAIVILYLFIRWRVKSVKTAASLKQHITETEIAALKAQMNPHFIFNCINSIDAFIHSNDKYNATLYLNKFAKLLRNILDSSKQNVVAFTKDTETLKLYIELEELRHENKFKTSINIDDELLSNDYKVPPLIIQPFVENAILHGLKNREDNEGLLQIEIKKVADKIEYSIKDNGIGRKAAAMIAQNKEASYGMQMSNDRIKLFNKEEKPSVQINDLYKDDIATGTEVKVLLNII